MLQPVMLGAPAWCPGDADSGGCFLMGSRVMDAGVTVTLQVEAHPQA